MIFLTDQFHKKVGFFQKNNYFFSTYMYQSDSKTSMISRVNICTTCINIFKTYNSIQCCIYSISFMNLFLIIHKTMFTCWTLPLYNSLDWLELKTSVYQTTHLYTIEKQHAYCMSILIYWWWFTWYSLHKILISMRLIKT